VNATVRDSRLSLAARGLLALMLSHADGYVMDAEKMKAEGLGTEAARQVVKELTEHGYAKRERVRADKGRWTWALRIIEHPQVSEIEAGKEADHTAPDHAWSDHTMVEPSTVQPPAVQPSTANPPMKYLKNKQVESSTSTTESLPVEIEQTKTDAKASGSAKKTRAPKSPKPDIPAREFQEAFIAAYGYTASAYSDGVFLSGIKRAYKIMHNSGMTPADVPDFIAYARATHNGKIPLGKYIADDVLPFDARRAADRAQLEIDYSVAPCEEYPQGLPKGIAPSDPMAAIYRTKPTDPTDPDFLAFVARKKVRHAHSA